jgi:hypothetical protein
MAMILTEQEKPLKAYNRVRDQNFLSNGLLGLTYWQNLIGV